MVDGLEDVADAEVDEGRQQGSGDGGGLWLLGSLLLLLLLRLGSTGGTGDLLLDLLNLLLDLLLGAVDKRGLATSGSSSGLLLLEALLLGLGVNGRLHIEDVVLVDLDLVAVLDVEAEEGGVLDEVDETDNVREALLAGALLGSPLSDNGGEGLVDGDIGLARLAAEEGGAAREVVVEGLEDSGLVVAGLETVRGGEPLLDLGLLGGSVCLGADGGHSCDVAGERPGRGEAAGSRTEDSKGEQGCCWKEEARGGFSCLSTRCRLGLMEIEGLKVGVSLTI